MKIEVALGRTRYGISTISNQTFEIWRMNADGRKSIPVPKELIFEAAKQILTKALTIEVQDRIERAIKQAGDEE